MADGRSRALWGHTSAILAMIANVNRAPNQRAVKPSEFNPHRNIPRPLVLDDLSALL